MYFITQYRDPNANLRTQLERILKRAGVPEWPKLFQNLRASRATELAAEFPAHVAAAWLGHRTLIAQKHYWQVTDDDDKTAAGKSSEKHVQKHVQNVHLECTEQCTLSTGPVHEKAEKYGEIGLFDNLQVTPTGLEPVLPP